MNGVKNCERAEILPYTQVNKLAWYSFIESSTRHETPESKTKTFITHGTASSFRFPFPLVLLPPAASRAMRRAQVHVAYVRDLCHWIFEKLLTFYNELETHLPFAQEEDIIFIILERKQILFLTEKETQSIFSCCLLYKQPWKEFEKTVRATAPKSYRSTENCLLKNDKNNFGIDSLKKEMKTSAWSNFCFLFPPH